MRFASKVGFYELNPFPGCNQLVVSNHSFVYPQFRGKGWGSITHERRLAHAKQLGYDCIICTVVSTNAKQKHLLTKHGWKYFHEFTSRESGNVVEIWGRTL